ncbi:MAG: hypothetical protein JW981_05680 [Anaerolineae bacterium]|nr:hypothetical protein [Anaerolineae bacterium]
MKCCKSLTLVIILALAAIIATTVLAAVDFPWVGALEPVELEHSIGIYPNTSLALADNESAVIWATEPTANGVYLARQTWGSIWTTESLFEDDTINAWNPALTYSGTQLMATWIQGTYYDPNTSAPSGAIMQQNIGQSAAQTIVTETYGYVAPQIVGNAGGTYVIYASAPDNTALQWNRRDLFFLYRPAGQTTWTTPTMIVTETQVFTQVSVGGTEYPKVALGTTENTLHIVWEQKARGSVEVPELSIWYITGTQNMEKSFIWGKPQMISPPEQNYAVRPNIEIDNRSNIHIIWSELIPGSSGISDPDAQYINYRYFANGNWSTPVRLNDVPIQVSNSFPTWATSSMDTRNDVVCVAWHGYYTIEGKEDITMRCSQNLGVSWDPLLNVSESINLLSIFPSLQLDDTGRIHIAWGEFEINRNSYGVFYRTGDSKSYQAYMPSIQRN